MLRWVMTTKSLKNILTECQPEYEFMNLPDLFDRDNVMSIEYMKNNIPDHIEGKRTLNINGIDIPINVWMSVTIESENKYNDEDFSLNCEITYVYPDRDDRILNVHVWDKHKNAVIDKLGL